MNWEQMRGKWDQFKGSAKQKWGKLTDDDISKINGSRDQLVGKIVERYGIAKEQAEKEIEDWGRQHGGTEGEPGQRKAS